MSEHEVDTRAVVSIGGLLLRAASLYPDNEAAVFPHERATYSELADRAQLVAASIAGLGVEPGAHIGVMLPNGLNTTATIFGISLAGCIVVPINTRYRSVELSFLVADGELSAVITSDEAADYADLPTLLADALPGLSEATDPAALSLSGFPTLRWIGSFGAGSRPGTIGEAQLRAAAAAQAGQPAEVVDVDDLALILYTSGTTASPRGCLLTHRSIVHCWTEVARIFELSSEDRLWAPCPLFHMGAVGPLLMCVASGATFVSDQFFEPDRALTLLETEHPTVLYPAYPPITQAVLTHERFASTDMSPARAMLNVGPPDLLRQMQAALPHVTQLSLYGLTEGGGAITYNGLDDSLDIRVETCGTALPGSEVRVVDPDSRAPLGPEATGEIEIRGVTVCKGYYNDPAKTAASFDADGWLATGDRGFLDPAGRLIFLGRIKEMLKVGGENVAQVEIEEHLARHPAVKLAQVVGAPDDRLGEVPAAFIELRPGYVLDEEQLLEHCRGKIARFKIPRYVRFVTEWPLSATKVQKEPLRQRIADELAGAATPPTR